MLFNSCEFLWFLPLVFLLYWFVFNPLKWRNFFIICASYVFYGYWDWKFLLLIALTTGCSFLSGIMLEKYESDRYTQKIISSINIIFNLVILGFFKYFNFFGENLAVLGKMFGLEIDWVTKDILLPVGISFYTFQAISYTIDVYQHKIKPTHDAGAFFAFVSFFPQLVAGPIERATNLLPQFLNNHTFDYNKAIDGMRQMLWGFFKKIVIADNCAIVVNEVFANYQELNGLTLLYGAFLFTFQIYGDFSGYSDIAIGVARLFGFDLMQNFNFPYYSRDIAEFWRKWHISLTTWFRDYIYIPLGGSRVKKWKVIRNTFIIFLVSGFWHGANWTFICWGLYHAILFLPLLLSGKNKRNKESLERKKLIPTLKETVQIITTFFLVMIGWIIFRADTITQAYIYIYRIISDFHLDISELHNKNAIISIIILIIYEWIDYNNKHALSFKQSFFKIKALRYLTYSIILLIIILLSANKQGNFIYFQF